MSKKAVVALSGGVDSAAAAYFLKKQGCEILALFFRLKEGCAQEEEKARLTAAGLGVDFFPVNLKAKFEKRVIEYFVKAYARGETPNPCIKCNRMVKFKELDRLRREFGADYMATGHYSDARKTDKGYALFKAKDNSKDQSYFLYTLTQKELRHLVLPLGGLQKEKVKMLVDRNFPGIKRRESQDICFLRFEGRIASHNEFLKKHARLQPGPIVDINSGKPVGTHKGLPLYTIGQRRGVEIGGTGPYYVTGKDREKNILLVSARADDPALYAGIFTISDTNWISGQEPGPEQEYDIVIRYRHDPVKAKIQKSGKYSFKILLNKPERAVTLGQSAVVYQRDELIGGGIITKIS